MMIQESIHGEIKQMKKNIEDAQRDIEDAQRRMLESVNEEQLTHAVNDFHHYQGECSGYKLAIRALERVLLIAELDR
jgi:F0F1-type ATP synthase membrane subunit b/b'